MPTNCFYAHSFIVFCEYKNVKQQKKKNYVLSVYKLCQMPIYTANEGPVRIQYMSGSDLFPEMKLRGLIISKTEL